MTTLALLTDLTQEVKDKLSEMDAGWEVKNVNSIEYKGGIIYTVLFEKK